MKILEDTDLRRDLSQKARQKALRFTWEEVARATLDAYMWVASQRQSRPSREVSEVSNVHPG